jgi:hypothetical protein
MPIIMWSFIAAPPGRWKMTVAPAAGEPLYVTVPDTGYRLSLLHDAQARASAAIWHATTFFMPRYLLSN